MKLDFSAIREAPENKPESSTAAFNGLGHKDISLEPKSPQNGLEWGIEEGKPAERLINQYQQEKADHERNLGVYKEYQHNIKNSGSLRADILKGAEKGEPPVVLLLKAVKCISLMTGDNVFYNQLEGEIISIYGAGLLEPEPLEIELQQVQKRLQNLQKALNRDTEQADSKKRIEGAIKAHIARQNQLKELIETGKTQL